MAIVVDEHFSVESLGPEYEAGRPVRPQADRSPNDSIPRYPHRRESKWWGQDGRASRS